jgi:hypothetical protein
MDSQLVNIKVSNEIIETLTLKCNNKGFNFSNVSIDKVKPWILVFDYLIKLKSVADCSTSNLSELQSILANIFVECIKKLNVKISKKIQFDHKWLNISNILRYLVVDINSDGILIYFLKLRPDITSIYCVETYGNNIEHIASMDWSIFEKVFGVIRQECVDYAPFPIITPEKIAVVNLNHFFDSSITIIVEDLVKTMDTVLISIDHLMNFKESNPLKGKAIGNRLLSNLLKSYKENSIILDLCIRKLDTPIPQDNFILQLKKWSEFNIAWTFFYMACVSVNIGDMTKYDLYVNLAKNATLTLNCKNLLHNTLIVAIKTTLKNFK